MFFKFRDIELCASVTGWSDYRFCWEAEEGVWGKKAVCKDEKEAKTYVPPLVLCTGWPLR